jgi:hypothetical protein
MTSADFTTAITTAATGALPYILGGVTAGFAVLAVSVGLKLGIGAFRKTAK